MIPGFKKFTDKIIKKDVIWDNEYNPKVKTSKTIKPDREYSFNEVSLHINRQLR